MSLLLLVIAIHFITGGIGILIINRKLAPEQRTQNLVKFFVYFFIYFVVMASVLINKNVFLGVSIVILSVSLFEILKLDRQQSDNLSRNRFFFISLALFFVICLFFSIFILLPSVLIAYTYTIVIIFDGSSQISGQVAGSRKILPEISPGKTLEGLIGGTITAVLTAVILHGFAGISVSYSMIFGFIVCFFSFMGDMAASVYKRAFNAKDFGKLLPGQGGMLDRFDSFLAAGAIVGLIGLLTFLRIDMVDRNIAAYLGYSLVYVLILLTAEFIHILFGIRSEYSRIFSHVLAGIFSLFMIKLFSSQWYIIAFCLQSAGFLFISKKMGLLGSHHKVSRETIGSSIFFAGILISYFMYEISGNISLFILPVTVLTVSDPVAAATGLSLKWGFWPGLFSATKSSKTFIGSLAFFVSAFIILYVGIPFFYNVTIPELVVYSLVISFITSATEAVSPNGTDNFSIPLVVSLLLGILTA